MNARKVLIAMLISSAIFLPYVAYATPLPDEERYWYLGKTKLDLSARPILFINSSNKEALQLYKAIPDERKPYLVVCGKEDGLEGLDYFLQSTDLLFCPSLVMFNEKRYGYMYASAEEELYKMRFPMLIGKSILPNPIIGASCHNAAIAAQQMNEVVVEPGEIFSFYDHVVPARENGYREGRTLYVTEDGPLWLPDLGGGICRTATALNFAVLNAGLEVAERHHHTEPVLYAAPGHDTSVTRSGGWDYKFKNTRDKPIKIVAQQKKGILVVEIYEILPEQI